VNAHKKTLQGEKSETKPGAGFLSMGEKAEAITSLLCSCTAVSSFVEESEIPSPKGKLVRRIPMG
jgi:hypothetical protein